MRSIVVALSLAIAPLTLTGACATFEQITPKSPRNALAEATVTFVGVADFTTVLYQRGVLSIGQTTAIAAKLEEIDSALNTAERLLIAGENVLAADTIADAVAALATLSHDLYALNKANPLVPAPVVVAAPPQI